MNDLGKTRFCLKTANRDKFKWDYTEKVLKQFGMDKAQPLSTPTVFQSLDINKNPYRPIEKNEAVLGPEVPYISVVGALIYLVQ